jgi:hypothetical protein
MALRLSTLRAGRALLSRNIFFCFWYSFLLEAELTPRQSASLRIRYIEKKLNYLIGCRNHDLGAYSIVLQPVALLRARKFLLNIFGIPYISIFYDMQNSLSHALSVCMFSVLLLKSARQDILYILKIHINTMRFTCVRSLLLLSSVVIGNFILLCLTFHPRMPYTYLPANL